LAEHVLAPADGKLPALGDTVAWETPFAALELAPGAGVVPSGRDRVKAAEAEDGRLSLLGFLQRFSGACMQVIEAVGMTEAYRRTGNRGFSTIETRLAVTAAPALGEGVVVASDILSIGSSSLRMLHRMSGAADGRALAQFYQAGVQLDLDARRPAPWPKEIHDRAAGLRVG
jgi:acyl-CoA thioesterase FadM